ncbi:MAG: hypothetical protein MK212_19150 [Saprospiraceae bacterium]|nr:hypothetical protein [Saprospiraceae bacterium]
MKYCLQTRKKVGRSINLIIQSSVLLGLFILLNTEIAASISPMVLLWQAVHYGLMAWCDYYTDDCPHKKSKYLVYSSMGLWTILALFAGVFESPYMRLHILIVLVGNWIGGKVDNRLWQLFFALYISIVAYFEFISPQLFSLDPNLLFYTAMAVVMIALCERLSELHQNAWLLYTLVFGLWAICQAPFYQESILFMLGSVTYAGLKLLMKIPVPQTVPSPTIHLDNEVIKPSILSPSTKSIAASIANTTQLPKISIVISPPQIVDPYTCPKIRQEHIDTFRITQKLRGKMMKNKSIISQPLNLKKNVNVLN